MIIARNFDEAKKEAAHVITDDYTKSVTISYIKEKDEWLVDYEEFSYEEWEEFTR